MKKIFGLFAMAALAATGLTCCGGGGGDSNSIAFSTLEFQAPGTTAATMVISISENYYNSKGTYDARYGFERRSFPYTGKFIVVDGLEGSAEITDSQNQVVKIDYDMVATINIDSNIENFLDDDAVEAYFYKFTDTLQKEDEEDDDNVRLENPPAPKLYLKYNEDMTGGTFTAQFDVEVEKEETDPVTGVTNKKKVTVPVFVQNLQFWKY